MKQWNWAAEAKQTDAYIKSMQRRGDSGENRKKRVLPEGKQAVAWVIRRNTNTWTVECPYCKKLHKHQQEERLQTPNCYDKFKVERPKYMVRLRYEG